MSLYNAMTTAISGLTAQSRKMGHISDNIANVSTVSYKKVGTDFSSMVTSSGKTMHNPAGVRSAPQYNVSIGGAVTASSMPTHMAIDGDGFFTVQNASDAADTVGLDKQRFYTRKGDFTTDLEGNLVNSSGYYLMGWEYNIDTGDLVDKDMKVANVGNITGISQRTENMQIGANLPAADIDNIFVAAPATADLQTADYFSEQVVYDGQGIPHTLRTAFFPRGAVGDTAPTAGWDIVVGEYDDVTDTWVEHYRLDDLDFAANGSMDGASPVVAADLTVGAGSTAVTLDATAAANGKLHIDFEPTDGALNWSWTAGDTIKMDFGKYDSPVGLTQKGTEYATTNLQQDGLAYGQYQTLSVDKYGDVYAHFSNGMSKAVWRIPVTVFSDPNSLELHDGGAYSDTAASGDPIILEAGVGRAGTVAPEALENSNVDLAEEFTHMIQAQRAYSANSRVITTSDEMLDEIIRLKR